MPYALAATEIPAPIAKVRTTLATALAIVHDQQTPPAERRRELLHLAETNLDLAQMAQGSLGDHADQLTPAERREFVGSFGAFIEAAYLTQIQDYVDLDIQVSKETDSSPDFAQVDATVLQPHDETMPITFMLERRGDDWMVYDVKVEGVSMVENYRAQFDRVIRHEGIAQLMADLRGKQQQLAALIGKRE